jgi:hypothetical protein
VYAPWNPLDLSTSWFAYYSNLVFWAPFYFCINLDSPRLVFSFLVCIFVLNTISLGMLSVYEKATGEKVKLSFEGNRNSNASSAYVMCFMCFDWIVIC